MPTVLPKHYSDVLMGSIASQITSLTTVYSSFYSGADQRKHQSSASLAFVRGIHRRPVNSPHNGPVTRKMFPFDDVIMNMCTVPLWCFVVVWLGHPHISGFLHWLTLTHWGRDKMAAIFQTTFSNAFSWMKMYQFRLKFHWSLFLRVQLIIFHHWFR